MILLLAQCSLVVSFGPVCLTCEDISNPADCTRVTHCKSHEKCSMEQFVTATGHLRYNISCKDSSKCGSASNPRATVICSQCCDTDLCSASLCGEAGFPRIHGPICYHCDSPVRSVQDCNNITFCGRDESCSVVGVVGGKYDMRCRTAPECTIFKQRASCADCCSSPLCNSHCTPHGCQDAGSCSGLLATFSSQGQDICNMHDLRHLCNKTCGLCPYSSKSAPSTITTTTAPPLSCQDAGSCSGLLATFSSQGQDICNMHDLRHLCNKTCGLCPYSSKSAPSTITTTTAPPLTTTSGCSDEAQCPILVSTFRASGVDVCQSGARYACNVTCNLCSGMPTIKTTTPKQLTTTVATTPRCIDEAQCPILISSFQASGEDVCQSKVRHLCNATCNLCSGMPTVKATTPKQLITTVVSGNPCLSNPCRHGMCIKYQTNYRCLCVEGYAGKNCEIVNKIRDCKDVQDHHISSPSGDDVYVIDVQGAKLNVRCAMLSDGGGWTVLLNRADNAVDFYKTSSEYALGFGDIRGDYWMGLEDMHYLTADGRRYQLRVDIVVANGTHLVQYYDDFSIGPRTDFTLSIGHTHGTAERAFSVSAPKLWNSLSRETRSSQTASSFKTHLKTELFREAFGDSLSGHSGFAFTTFDSDRDSNPGTNCAKYLVGGWWFHNCYNSCLTCPYRTPGTDGCASFSWNTAGYCVAIKAAKMSVRPM